MEVASQKRSESLTITLFGTFRVERNGRPLDGLHLREGWRLLAYLILKHREEITYRQLAERFWPAEARSLIDGGGELSSTRQALRSLRIALGPDADCLENCGRGRVRLNLPDDAVDLFQFDILASSGNPADVAAAIAIYRGPLLPDFTESWVASARNRRQREYDRLVTLNEGLHQPSPVTQINTRSAEHLPRPLTTFIGREQLVTDIVTLLKGVPLLTLTGTGGCGKTRLSLKAAEQLAGKYRDGIWFVDLTGISEDSEVVLTVSRTLNVEGGFTQEPTDAIVQHLHNRQLLLILDNCEHVLAGCRQFCNAIMSNCQKVTLLITSREILRMEGERVCVVPSLTMPPPGFNGTIDELSQFESIRLFVERARFLKASFTLTADNAMALCQLCWHLDGIPLAIELAAARIRTLSVAEINERLSDRFRLLTGGGAMRPPRQQTLRALIDWSYNLLSPTEAIAFERFSVFTGGWNLNAAEAVIAGDEIASEDVVDLLEALVDKSLIRVEDHSNATRYGMLESLREYSREKLREHGEDEAIRTAHQRYYLAFAQEAVSFLQGTEQLLWEKRLEEERDNLRSAFSWSISRTVDDTAQVIGRLGALFVDFQNRRQPASGQEPRPISSVLHSLYHTSPTAEEVGNLEQEMLRLTELACVVGRQATRSLLENGLTISRKVGDRLAQVRNLYGLAWLDGSEGDFEVSRSHYEHILELQRENEAEAAVVPGANLVDLVEMGNLAFYQGDYAASVTFFDQAKTTALTAGDKKMEALAWSGMGKTSIRRGDLVSAQLYFINSNLLNASLDDRTITFINLRGLGDIARLKGDYTLARRYYQQALQPFPEDVPDTEILATLESLSLLCVAREHFEQGTVCWAAVTAHRKRLKIPLSPADQTYLSAEYRQFRERLGQIAFATAWSRGLGMSLSEAITEVLTDSSLI